MKLGNFSTDLQTEPGRGLALLPEQFKAFLTFLQILLEEALHWFTTPVEVLVRRKFGCRWASPLLVSQLFLMACFGSTLGWFLVDPVFGVLALAPFVVSIYRVREARKWEREGHPWRHSYYRGEPHPWLWAVIENGLTRLGLRPKRWLTTNRIDRFAQPVLCLAVGLAVLPFSRLLGGYLVGASVALLVKAHLIHNRVVEMIRDTNDAQAMSQWLSEATAATSSPAADAETVFGVRVVLPLPEATPEPMPVPLPSNPRVSLRCPGCRSRLLATVTGHPQTRPCPKCATEVEVPAAIEAVC